MCISQWFFWMRVRLSISYYVLWLNEIINYEWNLVRNCYYKFWKIQMNFRLAYMAWFGLFSLKVFYSAHYFSVEVFKPWLFLEWFWFNTIFAFYNFAILFVSSFSAILVSALWVIYLLSCVMESIWKASLIFHPCLFANIFKLFFIILQQNLKQSNSK